jgi:hypothetical protein
MDENDVPSPNTLTVTLNTTEFSQSEMLIVRKVCNDLVSGGLLVEYCSIDTGEWHVALHFKTDAPELLWAKIQEKMYRHAELGERIAAGSWVIWHGEDSFLDYIYVYRPATPIQNQLDGFENRLRCPACERHFWRGQSEESGRCPYCNGSILARPAT